MEIESLSLEEWGDELPDAGRCVFHDPGLLALLEEHSGADDLLLYGGRKGNRLTGMLPLFVSRKQLGVRTVSSPPPGLHVPYLGPVIMSASPKVRKRERVNNRFTRGVLDQLDLGLRSLTHITCGPQYSDPRPYGWQGLGVETFFTYRIPIGDRTPDDLLGAFSKSRRREVRKEEDLPVRIEQGDVDDGRRIYQQTKDRFAEQNEYYGLTWPFVRDVIDTLGDRSRIYVAREPDEGFLSGIVVLYSNETALFWLGGVRRDYDNVSINSLLHWAIMRDIAEDPELDGVETYDMVGAGEYRLSKFKAKFGPELRPYYVVNSGGLKMEAAKLGYNLLERGRRRWPA